MYPSSYTPYSSNYKSSITPQSSRTSSHLLRSTFSTPSTSAYVSRTHLPFAPQSTLVAHCIAGVQSSTKPYGTGYRSPSNSSGYSSSSGSVNLSRPVSIRSNEPGISLTSRPSSTKRVSASNYVSSSPRPYYTSDVPSSSYRYQSLSPLNTSYSSYLSSNRSSAVGSSRASYRSTYTPSSYTYRPVRLRERPILTQIRHQLNDRKTSSYNKSEVETKSVKDQEKKQNDTNEPEKSIQNQDSQTQDSDWSSDVTRNISRNKYLIKFKEFDRRQSNIGFTVEPEKTITEPQDQTNTSESPILKLPQEEPTNSSTIAESKPDSIEPEPPTKPTEEEAMRIVEKEPEASKATSAHIKAPVKNDIHILESKKIDSIQESSSKQAKIKTDPTTETLEVSKEPPVVSKPKVGHVDITEKVSEPLDTKDSKAEPKVVKTRPRNIKLKLKQVAAPETPIQKPEAIIIAPVQPKTPPVELKANVTTDIFDKSTQNQAPETSVAAQGSPTKVKVKRLVKRDGAKKIPTPDQNKGSNGSKVIAENIPTTELKTKPKTGEPKKTAIAEKPKVQREHLKGVAITQQSTPIESCTVDQVKKVECEKPKQLLKDPDVKVTPSLPEIPPNQMQANVDKRIRFREYKLEDFDFLSVLGHGGWGFVILAELKQHDAYFAVKCIKKITIVEDDDFESIMIERKVLLLGNINPFICKLFCTFETDGYLFFVMEFCPGGDLMFHVQGEGKFSEPRCRFYAAEIICAIRFLHNRHIIYRDLKLDNILLDSNGHVRLVDFGMCQCRTYREEMLPSNFCGTPEYISPEIIKGVPYNHSVDWWSFGVLLYEMAVGKMPFRGNDENELLWNVCYEKIHYPMFLSRELTNLLQSLLEREPTKRMGMATCKAGDIKDQVWFRGVDWVAMESMRVKPPFVPRVESKRDVQNFDTDFTESKPELSPVDEKTLERIDQKQFQKFPYTNPDIHIFEAQTS